MMTTRDEEDDDKEIDDEGDEKEIEDEDDDNDKEKDDQDDEKEIEDEDDEKDKEDEDDHIVDIDDEDSHLHDTPIQGERSDGKIRRSKRVITRSGVLKSPWIDPNRKTKGKRRYDEKEHLFELCTTKSIPKDEVRSKEFVDMSGGTSRRVELLCLRPRNDYDCQDIGSINLDNGGTVTRHIFSPHFMEKIIENPMNWSLEANKAEILPDRIGYNIGDCRFIFGPSLRWDHWFCYVLDTTTMTFYALDSLVDSWTYSRIRRQMEEELKWEPR
ncbi:hypothetical protein K1719_010441 [Acacia pycnantha]|nr:hypothetical protein K1719_010441 [Acacia pycnantha]